MTDHLTPEERSWNMSRIRSKDTSPEKTVRSLLHRLGYRFRLHRRDLPGKPDIVLPKHSTVIFVHGCFWHRHEGCKYAYTPKSRIEFWNAKFQTNAQRDVAVQDQLRALGWRIIIVWECETHDVRSLEAHLSYLLCGEPTKVTHLSDLVAAEQSPQYDPH